MTSTRSRTRSRGAVSDRCARCAAYRRFSVATSSKSGDGANSADGGAAAGAKSTSHDEPATTDDVTTAAEGSAGGGNHPRQAGTNKEIKPGPGADIGSDGFTWLPDEQDAEAKGRGPKPRQVGVGADDFDGDAGGPPHPSAHDHWQKAISRAKMLGSFRGALRPGAGPSTCFFPEQHAWISLGPLNI